MSDVPTILTKQSIEQFLDSLKASGRQKQTIAMYQRSMEELYDYLPPEKEITESTLTEWKKFLRLSGHSQSTVNVRITAANGFLRFCGRKELAVAQERVVQNETVPEMTREEYLQFLSRVREIGNEKYYLMVKVFASVDVSIGELECLTVESCREGAMHLPDGRTVPIPACLREELLQYAFRNGTAGGPVFITRSGNLIDRSNITNSIHRLAVMAGMDPEKCCPSALHRVYLSMQEELRERLRPVYLQFYENLLNAEQAVVARNR